MSREIVHHFFEWAVTNDGLLYTGSYTNYFIPKDRLCDPNTDWVEHVGSKTFVIQEDFEEAYLASLEYHFPNK